jgi:hypothetical protein
MAMQSGPDVDAAKIGRPSQITDLGTRVPALVPASATDYTDAPGATVGAVNPGGVPPQLFTVNG